MSRSVDQVRGIDLRTTPRAERIVGVVETYTRINAHTQLSSCVEERTSCSTEFKRLAPDGRNIHIHLFCLIGIPPQSAFLPVGQLTVASHRNQLRSTYFWLNAVILFFVKPFCIISSFRSSKISSLIKYQ